MDRSDWDDAEMAMLQDARMTTPAQRLAWLEDALAFAWQTGALKRERDREVREAEVRWNAGAEGRPLRDQQRH